MAYGQKGRGKKYVHHAKEEKYEIYPVSQVLILFFFSKNHDNIRKKMLFWSVINAIYF
ncbi:hypothetical protein Hanom_Chr11g00988701 [Helianthus anomalus]